MLKRKQRALELLEDGKTVKEIAHELEVSIDTVYKYIKEFIKDGKVFNEVRKGDSSRKEFFNNIISVVTLLGGDLNDTL